jgi:hypothetical protein
MASQTVKGTGVTVNNGGTVVGGGNVDTTGPITNNFLLKEINSVPQSYGSKLIQKVATDEDFTNPDGLIAAKPTGTGGFAYNPERNFIVKGLNPTINGDSSDAVGLGSEYPDVPRFKKNVISGAKLLGNPTWEFPVLPGSGRHPGYTRGVNAGQVYDFTSPTDSGVAGEDKATHQTRAVPGEVTYRTGAPLPTTTNLKATDSYES